MSRDGALRSRARAVPVRAGDLHVRRWGTGDGPTVVLLHGNGDTGASWERVGPALAERGMAVIAPDLRGHGGSVRPPVGSYGLDQVADDVAELVRTCGWDHPVLVGHCWGAAVALAWAARVEPMTPEPAGLVLEELPTDLATTLSQPALADFLRLVRSPRDYVESWVALTCRAWDIADRENLLRSLASADEEVFLSVVADGARSGRLHPRLRGADVPALMLRGSPRHGSIIDDAAWAELGAWLPPGVRMREFPGSGHEVHRGDLRGYVEAIEQFVAALA